MRVSILFALACVLAALTTTPASASLYDGGSNAVFAAYQKLTSYFTTPMVYHPNPADAQSFLHYDTSLIGAQHIVNVRESLYHALNKVTGLWQQLSSTVRYTQAVSDDSKEYPYWRVVPAYVASAIPGTTDAQWSSACFEHNAASMYSNGDGSYTVSFTLKHGKSLCSDNYLLGTVEGVMLQSFSCLWAPLCDTTSSIIWTPASNATKAELFDIDNKGVRIFRFVDDTTTTIADLDATLKLFHPLTTVGVSDEDAAVNIDFLSKYAKYDTAKRSVQSVPIDESLIYSGDFFGILRLDGLDPMLAWAMGAHIGHTVLALWIGDQLYIIESTNKNSYWPTNGIQRTPYQTWLAQAKAAGYNLVWAPLTDSARQAFNASAALQYFESVEGFDYGYQTLLWAWQDTETGNYPCLPPDFESLCLTPHHVQILFGFLDKSLPTVGDVLFKEAWNKRIGTKGLSFAEILQYANASAGVSAVDIPLIVERDEWTYNTTRYGVVAQGPALVCCTFVCQVWKHGGLFGNLSDAINCNEQTNLDDYSLSLLAVPQPKPSQCSKADPNNPLCQLEGEYTVTLGDVYARRAPYAHMDEMCPGKAPDYSRPDDC